MSPASASPGFIWNHPGPVDYTPRVAVFYECQRCTACCRWPGDVRLTAAEVTRLAEWQQMGEFEFIQKFTRLTRDRRGLSLEEKPGGECIFLDGHECSVQPVKPHQCRDFPNLWNFPGFEKTCRALPRIVSDSEHARRVAAATERDSGRGSLLAPG